LKNINRKKKKKKRRKSDLIEREPAGEKKGSE
jgi:hypothetical protein